MQSDNTKFHSDLFFRWLQREDLPAISTSFHFSWHPDQKHGLEIICEDLEQEVLLLLLPVGRSCWQVSDRKWAGVPGDGRGSWPWSHDPYSWDVGGHELAQQDPWQFYGTWQPLLQRPILYLVAWRSRHGTHGHSPCPRRSRCLKEKSKFQVEVGSWKNPEPRQKSTMNLLNTAVSEVGS